MKAIDKTRFAPLLEEDKEEGGGTMAAIANNGGQPIPKPSIAKPMLPKVAVKR
jgi:hypothetical protein